ncbi:hypothetical protein [Brooklawnia cerclae]|uniref:hypothetical protein n=1 Tax=Brooklawnia cerclae TaxID=349934 RepID=UPI0035EBC0EC
MTGHAGSHFLVLADPAGASCAGGDRDDRDRALLPLRARSGCPDRARCGTATVAATLAEGVATAATATTATEVAGIRDGVQAALLGYGAIADGYADAVDADVLALYDELELTALEQLPECGPVLAGHLDDLTNGFPLLEDPAEHASDVVIAFLDDAEAALQTAQAVPAPPAGVDAAIAAIVPGAIAFRVAVDTSLYDDAAARVAYDCPAEPVAPVAPATETITRLPDAGPAPPRRSRSAPQRSCSSAPRCRRPPGGAPTSPASADTPADAPQRRGPRSTRARPQTANRPYPGGSGTAAIGAGVLKARSDLVQEERRGSIAPKSLATLPLLALRQRLWNLRTSWSRLESWQPLGEQRCAQEYYQCHRPDGAGWRVDVGISADEPEPREQLSDQPR